MTEAYLDLFEGRMSLVRRFCKRFCAGLERPCHNTEQEHHLFSRGDSISPGANIRSTRPSKNPQHCGTSEMPNMRDLAAGSTAFQKVKVLEGKCSASRRGKQNGFPYGE
jgi:hypothetical protein